MFYVNFIPFIRAYSDTKLLFFLIYQLFYQQFSIIFIKTFPKPLFIFVLIN